MEKAIVTSALGAYTPTNPAEESFLERILGFVAGNEAPDARSTLAGHLTASGWLLNPEGTHACLLLHGELGRWLQPGGHIEPIDGSLADAALREVVEETGVLAEMLERGALFDVDVHPIPAKRDVPGHVHYDCRFVFRCKPGVEISISSESKGYRWVALEELANDKDASTSRMAAKTVGGRAAAYFATKSKPSLA